MVNMMSRYLMDQYPVKTMFKIFLHCEGCKMKVKRCVRKIRGFEEISVDDHTCLVTVKEGMNAKLLKATLEKKIKRLVEVVLAKDNSKGGNSDGARKNFVGGDSGGAGKILRGLKQFFLGKYIRWEARFFSRNTHKIASKYTKRLRGGKEKKGKGSGGGDKEGKESGGDGQRVEETKGAFGMQVSV